MKSIRLLLGLSAASVLLLSHAVAIAQQSYPSRPIRVVVAWPPGGAADLTTRVAGQKLTEQLGQQLVVDNRPGASGAIGANLVAKAAPNGYTLLVGGVSELVLNPQIAPVPYDPVRDFTAVSPLAFGYYVMVVHPSVPAASVKELIAIAKSKPGTIKYASGGTGSNLSLVAELFKTTAGVDIAHVPYKGGGPAGLAVLSGESQMMFSGIATVLPFVQSKRLVALALSGTKRSALMPEVPTFAEGGMRGLDVGMWFTLFAPANTPREIVSRLNAEVVKLGATPDYRTQLDKLGFEPFTSSPDRGAALIRTEFDTWGKVIKAAGVKAE